MKIPRPIRGQDYKAGFAKRLKRIRADANLTQADMAAALHMETARYKKYESGRSVMPPWFVAVLCELTGVQAWWLLTGEGEQPAPPTHTADDPLIRRAVETLTRAPQSVRARVVPQIALLCAQTTTAPPERLAEASRKLASASRRARRAKA